MRTSAARIQMEWREWLRRRRTTENAAQPMLTADMPTTMASVPVSFGETIGEPVADAWSESSTGLGSIVTGRTDRVSLMASDAASVSVAVRTGAVATAAAIETGAVVVAPLADVVMRGVLAELEGGVDEDEVDVVAGGVLLGTAVAVAVAGA